MSLPSPKDEPVVYVGTAASAVAVVVAVVASFVHLSQDQINAIGALLLILGPPILAIIQRQFVTPVWRVKEQVPDPPA